MKIKEAILIVVVIVINAHILFGVYIPQWAHHLLVVVSIMLTVLFGLDLYRMIKRR